MEPAGIRDYGYSCLPVVAIRACTRSPTCPKVDDEIEKEDGVRDAVEDDPVCAEVVVEEGNSYGKDDEVGDEQNQHEQVPVESKTE